ncbi:MAG TPA: hypothetical protein VE078_08695 [Thermoanaerobaculia bacterium]|nr:hypothetical protein [Thermoanaerobaculia bacterium]
MLELRRLDSAGLLTHIHTALTGHPYPVAVPPTPCYLDCVLASADLLGGMEPRIGDHHIAAVSLHGFPAATTTGLLEPLQNLSFPYRFSTRFLFLDPASAAHDIRKIRAGWFRKRRGLGDMLRLALTPTPASGEEPKDTFANQDALAMATDADLALAEANSGAVRYGYYTATVVLFDSDRAALAEHVRQVLRTVRNHGVTASLETTNALEAFFGSLPSYGRHNIRRPLLHTLNLSHLLPTTSVYAGSARNPSPLFPPGSPALLWAATGGTTPFRFNLHSGGDVGHTLIVGPTGAGKSALVSLLQAQWLRYPRAQLFVFDKGGSSYPLAAAAGGVHYDVGAEEGLGFYPLQHVTDPAERAWAAGWFETLLAQQGLTVTPEHRAHLQRGLELLSTFPPDARTLSAFSSKLQDHALRTAIQPYTLAGLFGSLFDASHDPLRTSHYSVFEMASLLEVYQKAVTPILLYLFHRIEERLDGRPTLIVLEEAWSFLANSLFAEKISAWLRELRKKNSAVVFVTQSLSDLYTSPLRDVLLGSCRTKILLPNPEATTDAAAVYYRALGLNAREIEIIAGATPKRHYYLATPEGRRLLDLGLGPITLSFVGASSRDDIRAISQLRAVHGDRWSIEWLRSRNLHSQAEGLAALFEQGDLPCPTHFAAS